MHKITNNKNLKIKIENAKSIGNYFTDNEVEFLIQLVENNQEEITKVSKLQKEIDTLENRIEMFESEYGMIIE